MSIYESAAIGDENNPQPTLDPNFFQNAMGLDPEIGGTDALDDNGNIRGPYTRPPRDGTYAIAKDGFVFVSPSVYVVFPIIAATNDCGLVGDAYTSWTFGVPEHQLSTYQQGFGTSAFNPADLGCPGPDPGKLDDQFELEDEANQGAPSVLLPADLTSLDPAWKSCVLGGLDLGRDPPRALQPASNMAPKATSHDHAPIETQSVVFPHSTPKSPGPDPTQSKQTTRSAISSIPEDSRKVAIENVQEPSSVCWPVRRPPQSMPADSPASQLAAAQIRRRNNALNLDTAKATTSLPSSVKSYVSATSYAGVVSPILAWLSDLQSEASVGGLPPVAPSNPYLALPKHRSAKRSHTSLSVTQSLNTTNRFTDPAPSNPPVETSLVRLPATSAADLQRPRSSSPNVAATSAPITTPSPAPSDPEAAENGGSSYEPCGQGNLELAVITTHDVHLLSSTPDDSASIASWAATATFGSSSPTMEHSAGESHPSSSSGSTSKPQSVKGSEQSSSNIVTMERGHSSSITPAIGTPSLSGTTTSTHTATGCRIHVAESEGLWIAFLGSIVCFSLI